MLRPHFFIEHIKIMLLLNLILLNIFVAWPNSFDASPSTIRSLMSPIQFRVIAHLGTAVVERM